MIGFFPDPLPDELLYSVCARFSDRARYPNKKSVVGELFGTTNTIAVVDLPSHLDYLAASLPPLHRYTVDRFIDENTMLPFYNYFIPPERCRDIREAMCCFGGRLVHPRLGTSIVSRRMNLTQLRFCPLCREEDRRQYGEAYWHRLHQAEGVLVCPLHHVFLENSTARVPNRVNRFDFISAERATQPTSLRRLHATNPIHNFLLQVAIDSAWLLDQREFGPGLKFIRVRYGLLMYEQGTASLTGRLYARKLLAAFKAHYPADFLTVVRHEVDDSKDNWLLRLARLPRAATSPLKHLLLIRFLGVTPKELFNMPDKPKPFGDGHWPCLNRAAEHFGQLIVVECGLKRGRYDKEIIGTFSCECGFVYVRTGPDASPDDRLRIGYMKAFGPVWEAALKRLWGDTDVRVIEAARQLGVDRATVKYHAARLGLTFPNSMIKSRQTYRARLLIAAKTRLSRQKKRETYREMILSAIKADPKASRSSIKNEFIAAFCWLRAFDREWLYAHLPPSRQRPKPRTSTINWVKRDAELLELVKSSALRIRSSTERPIRVTVAAIGRDIDRREQLQKDLCNLPLTANGLSELVESFEDWAVRRVWWAARCFRRENISPIRNRLILRASINIKTLVSPEVIAAIDEAMEFLHSEFSQLAEKGIKAA
jgi:Tn7-like transposition protein D/TniQ protein